MGVLKNIADVLVMEGDKKIVWEFFLDAQKKNAALEGKEPDVNVLRFIYDVWTHCGLDKNAEIIRSLFHGGYCYYFALMLQDAFPGGYIAWASPFGHICYVYDGLPYDIEGIYMNEGILRPYEELGDTFEAFRHRGKDDVLKHEMIDFCEERGWSLEDLYWKVYELVPEEERTPIAAEYQKEIVIPGDATKHFRRFKDQL